ncbi:MAG: acyl-CoA/acyl-ACP dehydrogenase [Candidatus Obscuribacterales bacterium]|nr:acyl-CoA/acyl-ACP dehydrogenase [Candidatus Obscuribacterales bacterium]
MPTETCEKALDTAVKFLTEQAAQVDSKSAFPVESLNALAKNGLLGLLVPRQFGGMEASAPEFVRVVSGIAGACASSGMIFVMHCCGIDVINQLMKSSRKEEILRAAANGKHLSTLACSERSTGTHFYASYSKSKETESGFTLDADKCFVTSAGFADSYIVLTQAAASDSPIVTSLYFVPKGIAGQEFNGSWQGLGLRGNSSAEMKLQSCGLPFDYLLGESGNGLSLAMGKILPRFLLGTSAVYTGIARAAYEACCQHVKNRSYQHTGENLAQLATIRRSVAEMKVSLDALETFLQHAALKFDQVPPDPALLILLFEVKQLACKTALSIAEQAMQICGGIAYSGSLSIERHLRDALAGPVMAPTSDVLLDLIGKSALGLDLL